MSKKNNKGNLLFPLQHGDDLEFVNFDQDDSFFEEAFANHKKSALEHNRLFVGSVIPDKRYSLATIFIAIAFLILLGQTVNFQIFKGNDYRAQAENNRFRTRIIPAERGIIYDSNGRAITMNVPTFQIVASKVHLPKKSEELLAMLAELNKLIEFDREALLERVNDKEIRDEQILIREDLSYEEAMLFSSRRSEFTGFDIEIAPQRNYITDQIQSLSHLIGYTGIVNPDEYEKMRSLGYRRFDHIGKQGLESEYESLLRGTFGKEVLEVDALGNAERIISKIDPVDGASLYLSLDIEFQRQIEKIIVSNLEGKNAEKVSVIAMDPVTGEILSMVSWPAYDSNIFTKGIDQKSYDILLNDERLPMFPRAYAGEFPPGSTIKPTFAAAALMEGIIDKNTTITSVGGINVGPWFFPDWRSGGHGITNVYWAIADSVNTFFYLIGGGNENFNGMGIEKLMDYADLFGFGSQSGLDVPSEATGFLPSKEWKEQTKGELWYIGDTYHVSIGQGDFLSTPLQIARSTAVFANGGIMTEPHLNADTEIKAIRIIPEDIAKIVKDAMRQAVTKGSARSLQSVPIEVAGKTGTAQWSSTKPNHSWFTGFAPYNDPKIVVTVLVEEGSDGVDHLAIPMSREIFTWWANNR